MTEFKVPQRNIAISASNTSYGTGTVVLSGGTNITIGTTNQTITISGNNSFAAGMSTGGNTSGNTGVVGSRLVLAGGNNITLSGSTNGGSQTITISAGAAGGGNFSAGVSTAGNTAGSTGVTGTRLVLVGSNMVSLSQSTDANGGTISFNATQTVQTQDVLSIGASTGGNTAGNTTVNTGSRLVLAGGNNVTVSQGTAAGATTLTISAANQTTQSAIRAIGVSNTGNTAGNTGVSTGVDWVVAGSNNITASQSTAVGGPNTIWISGPTVGGAQTGISGIAASNTTYTSGSVTFSGVGGGVTVSSNTGQRVDISVAAPVAQTNQAGSVYASNNTFGTSSGTYDARTLTIAGDGIISVAASNSGWRISASQSVQTQDVLSIGASTGGNTAGNTTVNTGSRLVFAGGNNITVSQGTAAGATTLTISAFNQTAQSALEGLGVSNTGNTLGNTGISTGVDYVIAGSGAITASQSTAAGTNTIWLSVAAQTTQSAIKGLGVSNTGNTAGNTGVSSGIDWVIAGSNNITASQSTAVGGPNTIWISGGAGGAGLSAGISGGNTSGNTGTVTGQVVLAGGNNITLSGSTNGGSMTITVSAPNLGAGAMSAGISNLGNTAGSSGITGTQMVLVGTGPVSLSQSTGANGGTVSINAPATSSFSATGQVSISVNGSTISIGAPSPVTQSVFTPFPLGNNTVFSQVGNGTIAVFPALAEDMFSVSRGDIFASISVSSSSNSSHAGTISVYLGAYTRNVSTLSLLTSGSTHHVWTNTSNNSMGSISALRRLSVPFSMNNTFTGDLYFAAMTKTSTSNANWFTASNLLVTALTNTVIQGLIGEASNSTKGLALGHAVYSASSASLPNSMAFSDMNAQSNLRIPYMQLVNYTA